MDKKHKILLEALIELDRKEAVLEYTRPYKDAAIARHQARRRKERLKHEIKKDVLIGLVAIVAAYVTVISTVSVIFEG